MIELYRINLNLLVALDVLLETRNVTRGAEKLFLTQAAMSNNLQQLREIFKDDLLVRKKNAMTLTHYAQDLQPKLHQVLEELKTVVLAGQRFVPKLSQRTFKIKMPDYMSSLVLPKLLPILEAQAPQIKLTIVPSGSEEEADLSLGKLDMTAYEFEKELLFQDKIICIMNKKHPLARKRKISLKEYLNYQHVAIRHAHDRDTSLTDETLASLNVSRPIKVHLTYMGSVLQLIKASENLLGSITEKIAKMYQDQFNFVIKPLPFTMPLIDFYLLWHPRYQNDLGHQWLRKEISQLGFGK